MNNEEDLKLARKNAVHILREAPEEQHIRLTYWEQHANGRKFCAAGYLYYQIDKKITTGDLRGDLDQNYGINRDDHDTIVRLNDSHHLSFSDIADKLEERWGLND